MNKIKELLIKNVQWLTMLLGVAFVGWMAWTYFVQADLQVKVDQNTAEHAVPKLETDMNAVSKPIIVVPKYAGEVARGLAGPATRPTPGQWTTARPLYSDQPDTGGGTPTPAGPTPTNPKSGGPIKGQLTATPTLTAADVLGTSYGLSSIVPGVFATPGATPAAPPAGVASVDKAWITSAYKISVDQLAKDFAAVGTPASLVTEFLRCEVLREEVLPDGATANPVIVRPLTGSQLSLHPLPPAFDQAYVAWADPNQAEILQSPFYQVTGGSSWVLPGDKRAPSGPFDVSLYMTGPIPDWLTPEQKKLVTDARAAAQKKADDERRQKAKERPAARPSGGGGRGGGGGGIGGGGSGGFAPPPPPEFGNSIGISDWTGLGGEDAALFAAANRPPPAAPPSRGGTPPPGGNGDMPDSPSAPPAAVSLVGKVPATLFDPATWAKDNGATITAFAHDETVEPEKTYHYRMRFFVLNPTYGQPSATANPDLAKVFRWESNWSAWTSPYAVPPRISFFVISKISKGAQTVQFEVFHFSAGALHSKAFSVAPGDLIGSDENDGALATGYTLVDIRWDSAKNVGYALVMAPDGTLSRHDIGDTTTDRYRDLKNQATAPAVGTTGG